MTTLSQTMKKKFYAEGYELPKLKISKPNQVVTVRNNYTKEVVSSLRINGSTYAPKVMYQGDYTIEVGEGKHKKHYFDIEASKKNASVIEVEF